MKRQRRGWLPTQPQPGWGFIVGMLGTCGSLIYTLVSTGGVMWQ